AIPLLRFGLSVPLAVDIPMPQGNLPTESAKPCRDRFRDRNGAMPAARAADCNGEIALALALEARDEGCEPAFEPGKERCKARVLRHIGSDRRILAGQRGKLRHVMRIVEK